MEYKSFDLEVKTIEDDGTFEGYCAVFGNVDSWGDVIDPGAFTKTLAERPNVPILWQHDPYEPIGVSQKLTPDGHGLHAAGRIVGTTQRGHDALELMRAKAIKGLSIGYEAMKSARGRAGDGFDRKLLEVKLWEYSPVTFAANDLAEITAVKAMLQHMRDGALTFADLATLAEVKGAQGAPDFPFADLGHGWDASGAVDRWRAHTKSEDKPAAGYGRGFLYKDDGADGFDAYHLPLVDVIGGEPRIVPKAVFAIAGALDGARGANLPDSGALKKTVSGLYARMRSELKDDSLRAPWDDGKAGDLFLDLKEGRTLSAANRSLIEGAIHALQALLDGADGSSSEAAKSGHEPDEIHSAVESLRAIIRA